MRIFYTFLFFCFCLSTKAQIIEVPADVNFKVHKEFQKEQSLIQKKQESFQQRFHVPTSTSRDLIEQDLLVVISGDSNTTCPEVFGGSTIALANCSTLNFGSVELQDECVVYNANAGIDIGMDTVCVEICDAQMVCDTLQYPVLIKRPNGFLVQDLTTLDAEEDIIICADTTLFEGNFQSGQIVGCDIDDFGTTVTTAGNCFQYFAGTFSELDTVCFLICDQYSICDTFVYPFLVAQDTMGLPFFDDFSYDGPYPDEELWLTKDVFVNTSFGINPPSIGMATFDGLNSGGTPYGSSVTYSDFLVSTYLDLSPYNADSDVYLSFFIQPKGKGDNPDEDDLLILEFKNVQGVWDTVANYESIFFQGLDGPTSFDHKAIKIEQDQYLHSGFQFRFKNISSGLGVADLWHLDYVKVNANESPDPTSPDIAFVQASSSILKHYNAMPWHQFSGFENQELNNEMEIALFNHFGFTETAEPSTVTIVEQVTGTTVLAASELLKLDGTINQKDVPADTLVEYTNPFPSFSGNMSNSVFDSESELIFQTTYNFQQNEETTLTASNNEARRKTIFSNYYAYDDGTAEGNLAAQGAGTQAAVRFIANVADSLKGVQFHFPHLFADVSNQSFNLKVWVGDLDSDPVYERNLVRPLYADSVFDTLQGFTSYKLVDSDGNLTPVYIPAGEFYIGWEQVDNQFENAIPVGFDIDSESEDQEIFANTGTGWAPLAERFKGALMIRAVVGDEAAIETMVEEIEPTFDEVFNLFPNPTLGEITLILKDRDLKNYTLRIYSIEGILKFEEKQVNQTTTLNLGNGYYIVSLSNKDGSETLIKQLIINK